MGVIVGRKEATAVLREALCVAVRIVHAHVPCGNAVLGVALDGSADILVRTNHLDFAHSVGKAVELDIILVVKRHLAHLKRAPVQPFVQRVRHLDFLCVGDVESRLVLEVDGVVHPVTGLHIPCLADSLIAHHFIRIARLGDGGLFIVNGGGVQ